MPVSGALVVGCVVCVLVCVCVQLVCLPAGFSLHPVGLAVFLVCAVRYCGLGGFSLQSVFYSSRFFLVARVSRFFLLTAG